MRDKWHQPCLVRKGDHVAEGLLARDGLHVLVSLETAEKVFADKPHGRHGWFFNHSKDRYIAEITGGVGEFEVPPTWDEIVV